MFRKYGAYALLAGLTVAVVVGLIPRLDSDPVQIVLVALGLVGGAAIATRARISDFLTAGIALMLAASVRSEFARATSAADAVELTLRNVYVVTAAASLVLAVKVIVSTALKRSRA